MITVGDVLRIALPAGTHVVAGEAGMAREVTWATRPRPSAPAFAHLSGGELVLLSAPALANLDERMTLDAAIRQLAGFGVAAIAYVGRVGAAARAAANETGVAFLQLPGSSDLASLEREASHVILERRREVQRRGQEAGRRLMELAIAGETLPAIVRTLAEISERSVALEGRDGRILAYSPSAENGPGRGAIEPLLLESRGAIMEWLRFTAAGSPAEPPTGHYPLDGDWSRVVAPVIGRDGLLGNLSLIVRGREETSEDALLASRGSAACAVVMAREYATIAARREIEVNVLDEVLDGALRSETTLLQQARRLGHDLTAAHVVFVARIEQSGLGGVSRPRDSRWSVIDEVLARRGFRPLWRLRNTNAELLWPVAEAVEAKGAATLLFDDVSRSLAGSGSVVSMGVGRAKRGLAGIQQSHREAKQALLIGRRLHGAGQIMRFDDLGVYRLIFAAEQLPELREFHDEALSPLVEYDLAHGADLIATLRAFFDAKCGPKEAASLLGVHRNTVLYRLERIHAITGLDLDDANVRLRLHLALCVHLAGEGTS